jgi:sugar lactone lactonase YvrE
LGLGSRRSSGGLVKPLAKFAVLALAATLPILSVKSATAAPADLTLYAGGPGSGATATQIKQSINGLLVVGTTIYMSDYWSSVIRAYNISTGAETVIAGGPNPTVGDGGPATSASLNIPGGMAIDSSGNLYVAERYGERVRKITPGGTITTVAGSGAQGFSGDGGPATSAALAFPQDVGVDTAGNIYIADTGNNRVRKVDLSGNITTVAGNGGQCISADGPATSACITTTSIAVDGPGNFYVGDSNRIRKVDTGGTLTTVAGTGVQGFSGDGAAATAAQLSFPDAVRFDPGGNLIFSDTGNFRIRKVVLGGNISTLAGNGTTTYPGDGGAATAAGIQPVSEGMDGTGNLYIADTPPGTGSGWLRKVNTLQKISTLAGTGTQCGYVGDGATATLAQLCMPSGMAVDGSGNLFIADTFNNKVRKVTGAGTISTVAGTGAPGSTGDGAAATAALLNHPTAVAVDAAGNLYIADSNNNRVRVVSAGTINAFAGTGAAGFGGDGAGATAALLNAPSGVAVDGSGDVFIADTNNSRVRKVTGGTITTIAGTGVAGFSGDGGPATAAQVAFPSALAVDALNELFITDPGNSRVRKIASGVIDTVAGSGGTNCFGQPNGDGGLATDASVCPGGIAVDSRNELYIMDGRGEVRVVGPFGRISTVAGCDWTLGNGCAFAPVFGVPARQTSLPGSGVAVDPSGNIYVSLSNNGGESFIGRVEAPVAPGPPTGVTAVAGDGRVTVSWTPPVNTGGGQVVAYTVTPFQGVTPLAAKQVTGLPLPTTVTIPIPNGLAYTFRVTASTGFGTSPMSVPSNAVVPSAAPRGYINTHAGSVGVGPALTLGQVPYSLAVAASGSHLYVGDVGNAVVRDVDRGNGQETALAGKAAFGYTGDGGPAVAALTQGAYAIVSCGPGLTYIADTYNYVIRKIDGGGVITTVAGIGTPGYSGDGGVATKAQIGRVFGLACRTGGGLYIADSDNGAVRRLIGGVIDTWWFGFGFPTGIVEAGSQDVLDVSDTSSQAIWQVDNANFRLVAGTGVAGNTGDGGPATFAKLNGPRGLVYEQGSLIFADTNNNRIRMVSGGGTITAVAGTGVAGFSGDGGSVFAAQLDHPVGLALYNTGFLSNDVLFIADIGNDRVRAITGPLVSGPPTISTVVGNGTPSLSGDGGPAIQAQLGNPFAVAVDALGNQYVADNQNSVVRKIDAAGVITTVAGNGVFGFSGDGGPATAAELKDPQGVALDAAGNIYISDAAGQRVRRVDFASGNITTIAGNGTAGFSGDSGTATSAQLNFPVGVAVDSAGNVYIADRDNNRIRKVTPGGTITTFAGTGVAGYSGDGLAASAAMINSPRSLALDGTGNLFIADRSNNRIRKVSAGIITTVAGNGQFGLAGDNGPAIGAQLASPFGLALDGAGDLYIADTGNQRIRLVGTNGKISTVVADCGLIAGFSGDGGPASNAHVNSPLGLAVDAFDNLYIADVNNNRIRGATKLVGFRAGPCQSPGGTPGGRNANGSTSAPPPARLPAGGGMRTALIDQPLNGRASTGLNNPVRALPSRKATDGRPAVHPSRFGGSQAGSGSALSAPLVRPGDAVHAKLVAESQSTNNPFWMWVALPLLVMLLVGLVVFRRWRSHTSLGSADL